MKKLLKIFSLIFLFAVLVSCDNGSKEEIKLMDLENKTKEEIEVIFNDYEKDINLSFEYQYSNEIDTDVFISYKEPAKIGDVIEDEDEITIILSSLKQYLPDLEGKDKDGVEGAFNSILEEDPTLNLTLEYKYYYPEDNNEDVFVSYEDGYEKDDVIKTGKTITIYLNGNYVMYPEVSNKTEEEVIVIFNNLFEDYVDVEFSITYQGYYDEERDQGTIIDYFSNVEVGQPIKDLEEIVLIKSFKQLALPDLRGLQVFEIEDVFEALNVSLDNIIFMPDYSTYVQAGEFIKYGDDYKRGDLFDVKNDRLFIYYDFRQTLPDLEGLNQKQIESELSDLSLTYSFEYVVDNTQEYDTFAGYKDSEPGDEIISNMSIVVNLYSNDDVNVDDHIPNEKELFISKYIDGGINNQGIELYNPTDEEINLEDYYIAILPSGAFVPEEVIYLTGTLASKETYLIVNVNSTPEMLNKSHMQSSLMAFGVSASIQLRKSSNDTYIDSIYEVGNISVIMDNEIYVRKEAITHGRRNYVFLEWKGFVNNFYDLLGTHPYPGFEDPVFELIEDKTFQEYGMTKVKFLHVNDGDTANFESLDPRDEVSYSGDQRVRFLMVDTPEIGEPYKMAAQNFTDGLLKNAVEIYLQSSEAAGLAGTYGRHLALIWANNGTIENPNWQLVNYEILKQGLGALTIGKTPGYYNNPIFGNRHLYQWALDANNYAIENELGLYSGVHKN